MNNKKLGQIFLKDNQVAKKEIGYADIKKNDIVLEIGSGNGIITKLLAEKAEKVIAIEIDTKLVNKLRNILPRNVIFINNDALKINFNLLPKFNKIVSNLPYQISSPITFKILHYKFECAVLIYQKEFAERMVAKTNSNNYSRLSVSIYYRSICEIIEEVPRTSFDPQPKIDSCIVKLIPRDIPPFPVIDEKFFFELTNKLFTQRRKMIKNVVQKLYPYISIKKIPFMSNRIEELTPEEIGELSNILFKKIIH